jgi:chemotaxis protein CheD
MKSAKDVTDIFLQPGECFVGDAGYRIRTLLGSCVSVTLWHPVKRIGAMSHFLLSRRAGQAFELDGRYGDEAMRILLRGLVAAGVPPQECKAKIFGGGDMFPGKPKTYHVNIGHGNGETARRLLRKYQIPIVSESLFGVGHRNIIFDVATGDVWSRQVKPVEAAHPSVKECA